MVSLSGLALTGGMLYGGIKAIRNLQKKHSPRPLWLRETYLTATGAGAETIEWAVQADEMAGTDTTQGNSDSLLSHLLHDPQERQVSIVILTTATALIHILLGLQGGIPIFIWNGGGYLALLTGRYLVPQLATYRQALDDVLIAYTGTTIVAYFLVLGPAALTNSAGLLTKLAETGLIGLLWHEEGAG